LEEQQTSTASSTTSASSCSSVAAGAARAADWSWGSCGRGGRLCSTSATPGEFGSSEWAHGEIEFGIADGVEPGTWTGLANAAGRLRGALSPWQGLCVEAEEYREVDDERILVLIRYGGRGKTSGLSLADMQEPGSLVFHVRSGKVSRLVYYWDRERALADLGSAGEGDSSDGEASR
jgi:hypothetical protein